MLLPNTPGQANSEQAARGIILFINSDKTESTSFNQNVAISSLNDKPLKLVDQLISIGSNISSTESIVKAWISTDRLTTIWKSDLSDKIKQEIIPNSTHISTMVWLHHLDETLWEKLRQELYKDAKSCFDQFFKAVL